MGSEAPSSCKVILAAGIAKSLLAEVQDGLSKLPHSPKLIGFRKCHLLWYNSLWGPLDTIL